MAKAVQKGGSLGQLVREREVEERPPFIIRFLENFLNIIGGIIGGSFNTLLQIAADCQGT